MLSLPAITVANRTGVCRPSQASPPRCAATLLAWVRSLSLFLLNATFSVERVFVGQADWREFDALHGRVASGSGPPVAI